MVNKGFPWAVLGVGAAEGWRKRRHPAGEIKAQNVALGGLTTAVNKLDGQVERLHRQRQVLR